MSRQFFVRTYGCQMNLHDTEKVQNLLLHDGWAEAPDEEEADLLLINTCSIREKAENKLYSDLGALREWKEASPGRILGVGGCVAQQEGDTVLRRFRHLDFVFGTHNLRLVPGMAAAAAEGVREARIEESRSLERFDLPGPHPNATRKTPGRAFLTVMEGCDMFCSFCIVPTTRGREISRRADDILAEARVLAEAGVCEVTLLGQTVNAYGRHDVKRGKADESGTMPFGELIAELAQIPGLDRIRYTSPHPLFFDDALVRAHGELSELCPHVHMPLQSGSDRMLELMRRRYTAADYRKWVSRLREARPDLVLTTDIIVGHPGETEADFQATCELMADVGFVDAYLFKYSPRPGTAAVDSTEAPVPAEVAQRRLAMLQDQQRERTLAYNRSRVGDLTEVLLEGPSRRSESGQWRGRDPYHRVVNLDLERNGGPVGKAGERILARVVDATPHSLIGDLEGVGGSPHSGLKPDGRAADEQGSTTGM